MRKASLITIPLLMISTLIFTAAAALPASVKITPSGNGVFILQGSDFVNIGGIKATITYDQGTLKKPKVEKGSMIANAPGSMFLPNANIPGQVIIAAIQQSGGFNGNGPIAIISFERIGNSQGRITSLSTELAEQQGEQTKMVPDDKVEKTIQNPDGTQIASNTEPQTVPVPTTPNAGSTMNSGGTRIGSVTEGTANTGTTTNTGGTWLGSVTMPGEEQERPKETDKREEPMQNQTEERHVVASIPREQDSPSSKREEPKPGEKKFVPHKSLLDQFRDSKEPKTSQSLVALFNAFGAPGARQEPEVVLSDGKTKVKVYINLPAVGKQSPNFALKGAKLVSLKNEEKDKWVLEALPVKNSNDVKITALQDNVMTEIPLAVAQPMAATAVTKDGKLDPAAFALFLKERGTEKAPQFDLNGDKTRNYIDEYIFTANYIVKNGIKKTATMEPKKKLENATAPGKAPAKPVAGK